MYLIVISWLRASSRWQTIRRWRPRQPPPYSKPNRAGNSRLTPFRNHSSKRADTKTRIRRCSHICATCHDQIYIIEVLPLHGSTRTGIEVRRRHTYGYDDGIFFCFLHKICSVFFSYSASCGTLPTSMTNWINSLIIRWHATYIYIVLRSKFAHVSRGNEIHSIHCLLCSLFYHVNMPKIRAAPTLTHTRT